MLGYDHSYSSIKPVVQLIRYGLIGYEEPTSYHSFKFSKVKENEMFEKDKASKIIRVQKPEKDYWLNF